MEKGYSMNRVIHPRRSVLYVPGINARALEKARGLPVDCLIIDLEDSVAPDAKAEARAQVVQFLAESGFGNKEIVIRVNGIETPWGVDDIAAIPAMNPDAVVFPKIESVRGLEAAVNALSAAAVKPELPVWIMAETPRCILDIDEITGSQPRLEVVVMGTSDLAKAMRVPHTPQREGLLTALSLTILAARAHGLDILDGVFLDLNDPDGFKESCVQGCNMGFDGKTLIHPKQVAAANEIYGISAEEVAHARKVIAAWEIAEMEGKGVVLVDGRLVESLHVDEARRVLTMHEVIS